MTGDQLTSLLTVLIAAAFGLVGTFVGARLTQRAAASAREQEALAQARAAILRLAAVLVADNANEEAVSPVAEEAAAAVMTLGYGSQTALSLLEFAREWGRFEHGTYPRQRAREEILPVLDRMLADSLPRHLRLQRNDVVWEFKSAVQRPD